MTMDSEEVHTIHQCAGMYCRSVGKYLLTIIYLDKKGWFCELCKDDLVREGLVVPNTEQVAIDYEISCSQVKSTKNTQ